MFVAGGGYLSQFKCESVKHCHSDIRTVMLGSSSKLPIHMALTGHLMVVASRLSALFKSQYLIIILDIRLENDLTIDAGFYER